MANKEYILINELVERIKKEEFDPINQKMYQIVYQIIQQRKENKITQEKLADLAGVTKNTISRMETFTTTPSLPALLKIAAVLNLDISIRKIDSDT